MNVSFDTTKEDGELIKKISIRAREVYDGIWPDEAIDQQTIQMDIAATHCNGNPLNLQALLEADEFNFIHDIGGIAVNLNRETGKLDNCFLPRYSA